jgi:hypothetical protein
MKVVSWKFTLCSVSSNDPHSLLNQSYLVINIHAYCTVDTQTYLSRNELIMKEIMQLSGYENDGTLLWD